MEYEDLNFHEWDGTSFLKDIKCNRLVIKTENKIEEFDEPIHLTIWRDENYKLKSMFHTASVIRKNSLLSDDDLNTQIESPLTLIFSRINSDVTFTLEHSYLGNRSTNIENYTLNPKNYNEHHLLVGKIIIEYLSGHTITYVKDLFLNGPKSPFAFRRNTRVKHENKYHIKRGTTEREIVIDDSSNLRADHSYVKLDDYDLFIYKMLETLGPKWSNNLGMEFQFKNEKYQNYDNRIIVFEFVSFLLGRQLLNIGSNYFDSDDILIRRELRHPWGNNVISLCGLPSQPPVNIDAYSGPNNLENLIPNYIESYLSKRNIFNLDKALWRYWIAKNMPLGMDIPLYQNGIEILSTSWFKSAKTKTKGVYLSKDEFLALFFDELALIKEKGASIKYGDRIYRKISNAFNMSGNERLEQFFSEICLKIGSDEYKAIQSRNTLMHSYYEHDSEKIQKILHHSNVYLSLFHRIILKLLNCTEPYCDYSISYNHFKNLDDPSGMK